MESKCKCGTNCTCTNCGDNCSCTKSGCGSCGSCKTSSCNSCTDCKCGSNCQCDNCKVVLGYWGIQGLAQPLRYVLEYTKTPYTDKLYTSGEEWAKDKAEKPMDFPNVPYLNRCGVYYTESMAILHLIPVIAKQPQLLGGDEADRVRVQQLLGVIKDVASEVGKICYSKKEDFEGLKANGTEKTIRPKFTLLNKFLGKKDYLVGNYITIADFVLFYFIDLLTAMDAKIVEGFDGLIGLHKRIADIPQISKYRASGRIPKGWNGFSAAWGAPESA